MRTVFGASSRGDPNGGSCSKTSIPAPAIRPSLQRGGQGGLVDDPAPGDVEEERARLHPGELVAADEAPGRAAEGHVER